MSIKDLQAWLLAEGVRDDLGKVVRLTIRSELDDLEEEANQTDPESIDWQRLVFAGSILARSEARTNQEFALRIAIAALTLTKDISIRDAGAVLLGKLSNFRAVSLAVDRDLVAGNLDERLGLALQIENQRREMERLILLETSGTWMQANEFQQRFWMSAAKAGWLSASAPTASGKTFLVLQWLLDQLSAGESTVAIYLAPTRALVAEIETALGNMIGNRKDVEVSSLPLRNKYDSVRISGQRLVLVLTQERLHLLVNVLGDDFLIDLLIVDEAHKIGDGGRGVILQDAVERVTRKNPKMKVIFISPATKNPEELLADAPDNINTVSVNSDAPTVIQNVLLAQQVSGKPRRWMLQARQAENSIPIGTIELQSTPSSAIKRLAFIAAAAGKRGGTLVYANGAADSEDIADLISQFSTTVAIS